MKSTTVDGIDTAYSWDAQSGVLAVYQAGMRIADAQVCDQTECVYYDYFDDDGRMDDVGGASSDLYHQHSDADPEPLVRWLAATHPIHS